MMLELLFGPALRGEGSIFLFRAPLYTVIQTQDCTREGRRGELFSTVDSEQYRLPFSVCILRV